MKLHPGSLLLVLLAAGQTSGQPLELPSPPQQRARWAAPPNVPTNLLSAVNTLFEQGFPDPRGCEYREIEVEVSGVWGGKSLVAKTRGWVLPGKSGQAQRSAICWNGLVYPVTTVGAAADLHAEATALPALASWRFNSAIGETRSVFSTNALSTRLLLLLRSGETEAALKNRPVAGGAASLQPTLREPRDPYLELAADWAWALFDRTICAHMRGDEALALATARTLAEVEPKIEAEAAKRGFPRQRYYDTTRQGKEKPYLDFLEQLPQLLSDLERRGREGPRVSGIQSGLTNLTNQTRRITGLIRDLDLVQARQWGQPGGVVLAEDPIIGALIHEGDAAVEPLLDCLETDKRLTRSVGFGRDFFRSRTVIPVASAARTALLAILQANFGSAAEMRAYWQKYKGLKLEERWYAILRDDDAGMGRWVEAAANITRPTNIWSVPGTGFSVEHLAPTNAPICLRGEVLRAKTAPSVSELLARRATEVPATNVAGYDLSAACEIGLRLAAWDRPAAAPVAQALVARCRAALEYSDPRYGGGPQRLGTLLAKLSVVRAENGDAQAFADYAAWLVTTTPAQLDLSLADSLEPMCRYATNQLLQATAESLFGDTNSDWGTFPWKMTGFYNPVESGLANLPAFRRLLARELDRKEVCGFVEWQAPNMATFQLTNLLHLNTTRHFELPERDRPANGSRSELRWCDWIASSLANAKRIPGFNPFAPVARRDEAMTSAKAALNRPGS